MLNIPYETAAKVMNTIYKFCRMAYNILIGKTKIELPGIGNKTDA